MAAARLLVVLLAAGVAGCARAAAPAPAPQKRAAGGRALIVVDMQGCFLPGGSLPVALNATSQAALIANINSLVTRGGFDTVVWTQDWHPANHASFARSHRAAAFSTKNLTYTRGGRLCGGRAMGYPRRGTAACGGGAAAAAPAVTVSQVMWPAHCVAGSAEAKLVQGLLKAKRHLVFKKGTEPHIDAYSAFFDNGHLKTSGLAKKLRRRGITEVVVAGVAPDVCVKATALDAVAEGFGAAVVLDAAAPVSAEGAAAAEAALSAGGVALVETTSDYLGR